jgi:phage baseplate assembly protein gpV
VNASLSLSLFETVQRIVQEELGRARTAEIGIVQEQHPHVSASDGDNYACTVQLRDSGLVLRRVPVATQRIGAVSIPAVGDMVLVQFIGGDLNAPVITGSLYNDEDRPPLSDEGQAILHLPLAASDDDAVHVELHSGDRRALLVTLGGALSLTAQDDDPVLELTIDGGKASVKIDRDGAIAVQSNGKIALKGNEIAIEAQGELTLKGAKVNIN